MLSVITAEESRKLYAERKNQVLDLLSLARDYYHNENKEDKAETFDALYNDLLNGEFSIVVVGEFSAGKSTLLNALMGERILPSFSNETTATVNFLRHSEKAKSGEAGRVYYNDGEEEIIKDATLETIEHYVSTKGNDVAKKVSHLDLYLDSEFLKDGVTLVDSPGLNGVADGHREITEAQILKSHASIFLFNSDHPGSKTDFEFLHDLQTRVKTIIFVLNKIDEIKSDEGETPESVIETLKKTYKDKFPEETSVPEIWPVAAYPALVARNSEPLEYHDKKNRSSDEKKNLEDASRLKAFEDRLMSFLTCGEKTRSQLISPIERVLSLTEETKKEYNNEISILENKTDSSEITEKISEVQESLHGMQDRMVNSRRDISGKINEIVRDTREDLDAQMSRLQDNKLKEIDLFDDLDELMAYINSFEKIYLQRARSICITQEDNLRDKIVNLVQMQYANQSEIIEQGLNNTNIEINLSTSSHLDTSERVFEVGLKNMDAKIAEMENKIKELEKERDVSEENYYKLKNNERKYTELKEEIRNLQDRKDTIEAQMLPPINRYTENVPSYEARGGLLGMLGDIIFGEKKVNREELRTDSDEHDYAKAKQEAASRKLSDEISGKEEILNKYRDSDASYEELKQIKKSAEIETARQALTDLIKQNSASIEANYKKTIKKIKRELMNYCDEIKFDVDNQAKNFLRKSEESYIEVVINAVESTLKEALSEKQKQLEVLQAKLESSESDKNERISLLKEKIENINTLIEDAAGLYADISNVHVDTIQQQEI